MNSSQFFHINNRKEQAINYAKNIFSLIYKYNIKTEFENLLWEFKADKKPCLNLRSFEMVVLDK